MRKKVLVVAQELAVRAQIARTVHSAGYTVEIAPSRKRVFKLVADGNIEAAIMVMDSGPAATTLARELHAAVPRMILVADPMVEAIRPGRSLPAADAFLLQPLNEQELVDRLTQAMTSPAGTDDDTVSPSVLCFEGGRVNLAGHTFVDPNGRELPLTRSEFALLKAFICNPHRVLSRDHLRRAVVGQGVEPYDRSVDVLVGRLRRKIEPDPKAPRFILTVSGVGYKFAARRQIAETCEPQPRAIALEERIETERAPRASLKLADAIPAGPSIREADSQHSEPERRQLTVFCCGLVGAAGLTTNFDLEDIGSVIRSFEHACNTAIMRMGGSRARLMGEELRALFGYPQAHEDDAERAVQAGLDLMVMVNQLRSPSGEQLSVQIGIATGLVLISGEEQIVGEPLLIAARLRTAAPPNSLIVTTATRKLLGSSFDCHDRAPLALPGIPAPVTAYRITGRRPVKSRFDAKRPEKLTRLVGRQHELQQLLALWEKAKGGKGQVALVCGEAGIGKSRSCEALLDHIAGKPHNVIRYQCSPHHVSSPFHPIIKQLEHAAGFEREDTPAPKLEKLDALLSQTAAVSSADTALFAALLSIPTNERYALPESTPQRQKDLTIAALIRQVIGLANKQPLVIKLADAHWIDSSTLELVGRLIASVTAARVFVLISFRPEFFIPWLDHSHVSMFRLNRLGREQTQAMIEDLSMGKELPMDVSDQVINKTDGVPLFVEELTRAVLESGLLRDTGDRYVTDGSVPPLAIPMTLADSLTARLDKLGCAKEVAQIGAAIGREFSYRLIAAVASMSAESLQSALAQLAGPELIFVRGEPPESTYIFKHALIQDAAYATLLLSKRRHLDQRIACALEEGFPDIVETQPELLAHHFAQAGLTERAINYLRKAGQRTIERSANAEAIGHLTRALQLLQSFAEGPVRARMALELEVMLSHAAIASHGYAAPETKEILSRSRKLLDESTELSHKFAILYGAWACSYVGGAFLEQKAAAAELLAEAERHRDTPALCTAHRTFGTTCVITGEFTTGLRHLEQAWALYDSEQHARFRYQYGQDIGVAALCYLSWALWHLGYVNRASQVANEAVRRAEDLSHPHTLVYAICHARIFMHVFQRRADDIQSCADLIVSLSVENGFSHWINCGRIFHGWAAICRGEIDRGVEVLQAGVAAWRGSGARLWLPTFLALEAEAYAAGGRDDEALQAIERALIVSKQTGECWVTPELLRRKAGLLSTTAPDEIENLLVSSLALARRQGQRCFELRAAHELARLWQRQDRSDEALPLLRSVYDQAIEGFDAADLKAAKALIDDLTLSSR
jgi:DNA-binding response OmpR family regulator/class 3 adenylate cyclase/tetratricopeptide (TPR) repeat protein